MQREDEGGRKRSQSQQQQAQPKTQRSPPQQVQGRAQAAKQHRCQAPAQAHHEERGQAQDDGSWDDIFEEAAKLVSAVDDLRRFGLLSEEHSRAILLPPEQSQRTTQQDIVANLLRRLRTFSANPLTTAEQRRLVGVAAGVITYYRTPRAGPQPQQQRSLSQRPKQGHTQPQHQCTLPSEPGRAEALQRRGQVQQRRTESPPADEERQISQVLSEMQNSLCLISKAEAQRLLSHEEDIAAWRELLEAVKRRLRYYERSAKTIAGQHEVIARGRHTLEVLLPSYRAARDKARQENSQSTQEHSDPLLALLPYLE